MLSLAGMVNSDIIFYTNSYSFLHNYLFSGVNNCLNFLFSWFLNLLITDLSLLGFPHSSVGKESAYSARDPGLTPGSGRSPGEGNGNPLQYCCLENPMGRGARWAAVHGVPRVRHSLAAKPPPTSLPPDLPSVVRSSSRCCQAHSHHLHLSLPKKGLAETSAVTSLECWASRLMHSSHPGIPFLHHPGMPFVF